ncbi:zinc-binding dehydrogenase [Rhizobium bangladeshense]|uniref:zinc-binding dehydrogenase n=1 Tax=Rhizobium bangladeshense TaxID=1138189 RepID=UPI00247822F7|nr:zinc-binding dehydrogenase [Rhizobium bangladeshense]
MPKRETKARALGADETINYSIPDWEKAVLDLTDGVGADVVLDMVGASSFARSLAAARQGGVV